MIFRFDRACTCPAHKIEYAPHSKRDETPERLIEHLSVDDRRAFDAAMEQFFVDSSRHEAGHCIVAAATGRKTNYLTIGGGAPHIEYRPCTQTPNVLDLVMTTAAGVVAERVGDGRTWNPTWSSLCEAIRKARSGEAGSCDVCHVSRILVAYFPDCADETLTESWFGVISATHALMRDDQVGDAMLALAAELHEKTLLEQPRIDEILAPYDLAGAMDRALEPLILTELLPAWRQHLK